MKTLIEQIDMMKTPRRWPQWPALPVKHKTKRDGPFPQIGIMFDTGKPVVYDIGLFDLGSKGCLDGVAKFEYASFEELAKIWEVD